MVVECIHKGVALGQYQLGAYVVMANHVHVLLLPRIAPIRLLQSLKGFTRTLIFLLLEVLAD